MSNTNQFISVLLWVTYGLAFLIALFCAFIAILSWPFDRHRTLTNSIFMSAGRSIISINPFWQVNYQGLRNYVRGRRVVFVANHRSFLDMPLLASLPWNMKWISKNEIFRVPVIGWLMYWSGHVKVHRGSAAAARALTKLKPYIHDAIPVIVFPEGTRSATGELLPFKNGAFQLAIETNATIIPIITYGTHEILKPNQWRMTLKGSMIVKVLEPVSSDTFTDVNHLKRYVYDRMLNEFNGLKREALSN